MSEDKNNEEERALTPEEHKMNYLKAMVAIDRAMEPLREHSKALKESYVENDWLTRPEMSLILKAYRANKDENFDIENFDEAFSFVKEKLSMV